MSSVDRCGFSRAWPSSPSTPGAPDVVSGVPAYTPKYRGRKPIASGKRDAILQLAASGRTKAQIAHEVEVGEATVYRILARAKTPQT